MKLALARGAVAAFAAVVAVGCGGAGGDEHHFAVDAIDAALNAASQADR